MLIPSREFDIPPETYAEQLELVRQYRRSGRCTHVVRWWRPCGQPATAKTAKGPRCEEHQEPS